MVCLTAAIAAEKPWQRIEVVSVADGASHFRTPPPEYGMTLWWGWDGPMNEEVITRDLDAIKARGFHTVTIEPGYNMRAPYLSQGWFELVRTAVQQAARRDMKVWIVDEGKYPSGFAGGKFSEERPGLRMQALVVGERIPVAAGETLSRKVSADTVGAVAVDQDGNRNQPIEIGGGELRWTAPADGEWQVLIVQHQFRTSPTRAANDPTRAKTTRNSLEDYLNPAATQQFLAWTEEQYKKYMGADFGSTILGFRGDEPDYSISGIPWTPKFFDEFQRVKGYDVRPYVASFFAPHPTEEQRRAKADYWDVFSDMFRDGFFKPQGQWCTANGVEYLVHLNHEDMLMQLARSEGDFFKDMRYVEVPGIDTIWHQIWMDDAADFPKLASSAAHLFGRPRAFTESFAAYRPAPDLKQAQWIINEQLVRGINLVEIMFWSSTANGPHEFRGFLGDEKFPDLARYGNRATYLLAQGRPAADIGVYVPTSSLWLGDANADRTLLKVARALLEHQRDFDFVDEQSLSSLLTLQKGAIRNLSGSEYRTIVVPGAELISQESLDRLQAFARSGGHAVFFGKTPTLVSGRTILHAAKAPDFGWAVVEPSADLTPKVLAALPPPDVTLDRPAPPVKYLHRRWKDADFYMFFNESDQPQARAATLAGAGSVEVWDPTAGTISPPAAATSEKGTVRVALDLGPWETRFITVGTAAPSM